MADDAAAKAGDRILWAWTGAELLALVAFFLLFAPAALAGRGFGSFSAGFVRLAWGFLLLELLIPPAVYVDMRHRGDVEHTWLHVAAAPFLNLVGLVAYLSRRG
jgi:hypothetical protein